VIIGYDCVIAILHVSDCGFSVMSLGQVGACATLVIVVETKAMHPTIIHVESIIGYNGLHDGRSPPRDWNQHGCLCYGWFDVCHIGAVEPNLTGG